jgi:LysM repeat protein
MRAIFGNNCAKGCFIYVIAVVAIVIVASMGLGGLRAKFGGAEVEGNRPQYTIQSTGQTTGQAATGTVASTVQQPQTTLPDPMAGGGGGTIPTTTPVPVAPIQSIGNATPAPSKGQGGTITGDGGDPFYIVHSGDTLWTIARTFGVDLDSLTSLNGLNDSMIYAGQVLYLPTSNQQQAAQPTPTEVSGVSGSGSGDGVGVGDSGAPAIPSMPDTGINKKP